MIEKRDSDCIRELILENPSFHEMETETKQSFSRGESVLSSADVARIQSGGRTCYSVIPEVLEYIAANVDGTSTTLETGAGCSTLVFAVRRAKHHAVTPAAADISLIKDYAEKRCIPLDRVTFVESPSELYLPNCPAKNLAWS